MSQMIEPLRPINLGEQALRFDPEAFSIVRRDDSQGVEKRIEFLERISGLRIVKDDLAD